MRPERPQRVGEEIKKLVSHQIQRELKDPRIGFATVTDVEVSGDLQHAKIFISVYGSEQEKTETMEGLRHARGHIRSIIGAEMRLRHTPEIVFKFDDSIARGARIMELLEGIKDDEENGGKQG